MTFLKKLIPITFFLLIFSSVESFSQNYAKIFTNNNIIICDSLDINNNKVEFFDIEKGISYSLPLNSVDRIISKNDNILYPESSKEFEEISERYSGQGILLIDYKYTPDRSTPTWFRKNIYDENPFTTRVSTILTELRGTDKLISYKSKENTLKYGVPSGRVQIKLLLEEGNYSLSLWHIIHDFKHKIPNFDSWIKRERNKYASHFDFDVKIEELKVTKLSFGLEEEYYNRNKTGIGRFLSEKGSVKKNEITYQRPYIFENYDAFKNGNFDN